MNPVEGIQVGEGKGGGGWCWWEVGWIMGEMGVHPGGTQGRRGEESGCALSNIGDFILHSVFIPSRLVYIGTASHGRYKHEFSFSLIF